MSVKYKSIKHKNLKDPTAPPRHYVMVYAPEVTDIDGLSKLISDKSTVSRPDVYAVIMALLESIISELMDGRMVSLGKLGTFALMVHSEGVENAGEVSAELIKKVHILYRPGKELKDMLKKLHYEKA